MKTKAIILFWVLLFVLGGCAVQSTQCGDFVKNLKPQDKQVVIDDFVKKMVEIFPPAKTRLVMGQEIKDPFGNKIIKNLREKGYAIATSNTPDNNEDNQNKINIFTYVFAKDQLSGKNVYWLNIKVGEQRLSRPYIIHYGKIVPAGYWTHREG